jgi:hypothetical protein
MGLHLERATWEPTSGGRSAAQEDRNSYADRQRRTVSSQGAGEAAGKTEYRDFPEWGARYHRLTGANDHNKDQVRMLKPIRLFRSKKEAEEIVGSLSNPSKMPGHAYSIPAIECHTGGKLRDVKGSVCYDCYACKGRYYFTPVILAMYRRFDSLDHPLWVDAMVHLIKQSGDTHFRWHDSGDLQSHAHLSNIIEVANRLPDVSFWLPTKEKSLINQYFSSNSCPSNLTVRLSSPMLDTVLSKSKFLTSSVHKDTEPVGHECPAPAQGNECGSCRACWDPTVKNVAYHHH